MKRFKISYGLLLALLLIAGCSKERFVPAPKQEQEKVSIDYSAPVFSTALETEDETKTQFSDSHLRWSANDRVSVFCATTANLQYAFCGNDGDRTGILGRVAGTASQEGESVSCNYAVYPYDPNITLSEGTLTLSFPKTQTYAKGTFGPNSSTMVAVSQNASDHSLKFKNTTGYLVVKLYGSMTVKQVTLQSYNGEKISGKAQVTPSYSGAPTIVMSADADDKIVLDCGKGVKIGETSETATEFWFAVPPVTFSQGFTVNVTDTEGKTFTRTRSAAGTIARNKIISVNPFRVSNKAGEYVRMISEPELFDKARIESLIKESGVEVSSTILDIGYGLIDDNGSIMLNRVVYTTTDRFGNIVEASGIITYATKYLGKEYSKITSVSHVTCNMDAAPSVSELPYEAVAAFKSGNQVVTIADYLGYGVSQTADQQHPYMVDKLTGTACADLVDASESFLAEAGLKKASTVTVSLVGYSQGGAGVISTLKELEKRGHTIGKIQAGSGPHDLMEYFNVVIKTPSNPNVNLGFVLFAVRGLIYGENLDVDIHNIYAPELFSSGAYSKLGTTPIMGWSSLIGSDVRKIFHTDFFKENYNDNADIKKLMECVERNSTLNYNGKYKKNIELWAGESDDMVPYACSQNAKKKWGCSLTKFDYDSHFECAIEFYVKYVIGYLDGWSLTKAAEWKAIKVVIDNYM